MGLLRDLGRGPVAIDTAIFIYFIEENARYLPLVEPVFRLVDREELPAFASALTLLETLVLPLRSGKTELAKAYDALLTRSRGLTLVDLDRPVLRAAARLRAVSGIKTPDAIQLASALTGGCNVFLTNDRRLPGIPGLSVLTLEDYAAEKP